MIIMSYTEALSKLREWAATSPSKERLQLPSTNVRGLHKKYKANTSGFMSRLFSDSGGETSSEGLGNSMYIDLLEEREAFTGGQEASQEVSYKTPTKTSSTPVARDTSGNGYGNVTKAQVESTIKKEANLRGISPDIALRVAASEGLTTYASQIPRGGGLEQSFGPYQLFMDGGLGNIFKEETGIHPGTDRSLSSIRKQIQFSLDSAAKSGWGAWHGAGKVGIGRWDGLKGAKPIGNWRK